MFFAKLRSELDLLHSETKRSLLPPRKESSIDLPGDHVRTPGPHHLTRSQSMTSLGSGLDRAGGPASGFLLERNADRLGDSTSSHGNGELGLPGQFSPLSPTFGPRRGFVPTGAVAQRKSYVPFNQVSSNETTADAPCDRAAHVSRKRPYRRKSFWRDDRRHESSEEDYTFGCMAKE
jgi:hypothetical protein